MSDENENQIDTAENRIDETIDGAEEVRDPLEGLVEKTKIDPGAPFTPEVLERLAALKTDDRAAFEKRRAQLKIAGCRVTALDEALAEESGDAGGRGPTQADILIDIAQAAELFHTANSTGFADLDVNGHRETWPIRSKGFRRWLARRFFEETDGAPNSEALQSALNVIEAKAHFDAPERAVHIRVGGLDGRLYLDLCDETWRAVEIDTAGWRVIDNPPVRFRRAAGMKPLPVPVSGGSVETLRSFLNVRSDADFVLVVAWALACLRNCGPYPVVALSGEQGSAKSTFSAILRALLDPNTAPLRALPREDRDLFIAASNGHLLAFDNVSVLPAWISDTLCRLATGGGFAVRQLYTDQDEVLFDAARPVILNGIEEIVTRPDLADRALFLTLDPIPEERRRPEAELWARFDAERPRVPGRAARCCGDGASAAARDRADAASAHGRFCDLGDGVRDGALAHRHLLVGLLWQPRRGDSGRDRRRFDRHRCADVHGRADDVDRDGHGPARPAWSHCGGESHECQDLAGRCYAARRQAAPGGNLPAQGRHRDQRRRAAGTRTNPQHHHHHRFRTQRGREFSVRSVRSVRCGGSASAYGR
jgi:hypothetical protein